MPLTDPTGAPVPERPTLPPSPASSEPLAHTCYQTLAVLGRGGTGEVVEVEHRALHKRMVVKLLHRALAGNPILVDRMRLEAEALGRISPHPNIVEVIDVGTTSDGRPFIVMERLRGCTLRQEIILRGHVPVEEAITITLEILAGLAAAHRAGVVHRDVKPANLFLCEPLAGGKRTLKILDFGIAKVVAPESDGAPSPLALATTTGFVLGTPRFIAPEQTLGNPVDARADLYAVSAVLYTMLAGRDPYAHINRVTELLRAKTAELAEAPSRAAPQPVSPALDAVVLKGLATRPEDRFQNAAEFAAALQTLSVRTGPRWPKTEPLTAIRERIAQLPPPALAPPAPVLSEPPAVEPHDSVTVARRTPPASHVRQVLVAAAIVFASVLASVIVTLVLARMLGTNTPRIEYRMTRACARLANG